jgi:uncharacterized protein YoxC
MTFSNTEAHLASKRVGNAIQRVEALEGQVTSIIDSTNKALDDIHQKLARLQQQVLAVCDVVGQDAVSAKVVENMTNNDLVRTQNLTARTAEAVANGELKVAEVIGDSSMLVMVEKDKEGNPLRSGSRQHMAVPQILQPFRSQLLGKGVGETITSESGHTFTVVEVYDIVPAATPAPETK